MNLMLHCDAKDTTWKDLCNVRTPEPTKTHHPVPHHVLFSMVKDQMTLQGYKITDMQHGITHGGSRYFGVMQLKSFTDWSPIVGLRNSHDKSITADLCFGTSVFVCDNMAFYGDLFSLSRKHTNRIENDLPERIKAAVAMTDMHTKRMEVTINHYKKRHITSRVAHDIIVRALDEGAIVSRRIPHVLEEWRNPRHNEFKKRNAWSLFNAFTESMKSANSIQTHVSRTSKLHKVFDKKLRTHKKLNEIVLSV